MTPMGGTRCRFPAPSPLLVALLSAGCVQTYRPTIDYPQLVEAGAREAGYDCAQLDDAIMKADAVRWVMRVDGAHLLTVNERHTRTAANVVLILLPTVLSGGPAVAAINDEGHEALERADRRIVSLLALKKTANCPANATAFAARTDLQLLAEVEALNADIAAGRLDEREGFGQRTLLLDGLREGATPIEPAAKPVAPEQEQETVP